MIKHKINHLQNLFRIFNFTKGALPFGPILRDEAFAVNKYSYTLQRPDRDKKNT